MTRKSTSFPISECLSFHITSTEGHVNCRSSDIPAMHRNKRDFTPILAVIPGKTEPKNLDAYWQVMLEDFHQCGPYGGNFTVWQFACCQMLLQH